VKPPVVVVVAFARSLNTPPFPFSEAQRRKCTDTVLLFFVFFSRGGGGGGGGEEQMNFYIFKI
jgi:hypothetical protein